MTFDLLGQTIRTRVRRGQLEVNVKDLSGLLDVLGVPDTGLPDTGRFLSLQGAAEALYDAGFALGGLGRTLSLTALTVLIQAQEDGAYPGLTSQGLGQFDVLPIFADLDPEEAAALSDRVITLVAGSDRAKVRIDRKTRRGEPILSALRPKERETFSTVIGLLNHLSDLDPGEALTRVEAFLA